MSTGDRLGYIGPMTRDTKLTQKRTLTKQKVVAKALAIVDADGLDSLSMRRLAHSLGVTPMSLYNHIANKDMLLDEMVNAVVAKIETPTVGGAWDVMMRRRARSFRSVLLAHPWAPVQLVSRIAMGEAVLHDINATVGCLIEAGFTYAQADWIRNSIDSHVYGYTLQELNYPVDPETYRSAAAQFLPMIPVTQYPYMHAAAQQIIDGQYDGRTQFDFGLDIILDGVRRRWVNG